MRKLIRILRRMTNLMYMGLLMLGIFTACAGLVNVYVGLIGIALIGLLLFRGRTDSSDWKPNVRGENPYQILGVTQDADTAAIHRAFREQERTHHPDAVPEVRKAEATALFIRINQAYELLSDREKRYEYDHLLDQCEGVIPPLDEAFRLIKDVHKHEIYEEYDALHPPAPIYPARITDADPPSQLPPMVVEPPASVEVEMPESVRESLGLPPVPDRSRTTGEGTNDERPR